MDCKYEGPFTVGKILSGGMSYIIEGQEKCLNVYFSHLKSGLDPPIYFERQQNIDNTLVLKEILHYSRSTSEIKNLKSKEITTIQS